MIYFQPEYVKNFKCDGKRCGAKCCKHWIIDIDEKTFDSYKKIESVAKEITANIYYHDERKGYVTKLRENKFCPFLNDDNLCMIQKNFGENFLSSICQTFPRHIIKIDDLYERAMNLTCPLVAEMVLLPKSPMNFELVEEPSPTDSKILVQVMSDIFGKDLPQVSEIQMVATFILQRRNLTIDQRLAILGIYFENLEKIFSDGDTKKISGLTEIFTSKNFLLNEVFTLLSYINFNAKDFISTLFIDVLKPFYVDDDSHKTFRTMIFGALKNTFDINYSEDKISVDSAAKKFILLSDDYKNFVQICSTILENYLVHEFFLHTYPWRITKSICFNYGIFVASYKIVEFILFSLFKSYHGISVNDIIKTITLLSISVNHSPSYMKNLEAAIEKFDDVGKIISTFLQTKGR